MSTEKELKKLADKEAKRVREMNFRIITYLLYVNPRGKRYNYRIGSRLCLNENMKEFEKSIEEENSFLFETMEDVSKDLVKKRTKWHILYKKFKYNKIVKKFRNSKDIPKSAHILIFIDMYENITCVWLKQKNGVRKLNCRQWESLIKKIKKGKGENLIYIKGNDKKSVIKKGILKAKEFERKLKEKNEQSKNQVSRD